MTVHEYIKNNWANTTKRADASEKTLFKLPKPYTTPCASSLFINFFYWDTYFANLGLMLDGMEEQAENNLDTMKFFIDFLGYVPNADHLITRTQPPVFTRGVWDYYQLKGDKAVIEKYVSSIIRELSFFESDRKTECGLNAYGNCETNFGKEWYYEEFDRRLQYTESEKQIEKFEFVDNLLAIAESGWDFNPRFKVPGNRFASTSFAHLDLNCLLYDAEVKLSQMLTIIGRAEEAEVYAKKAEDRRDLINKYMRDEETGIYLDYNFKTGKLSETLSAASFYPYALGISTDAESVVKVLEGLDLPYGISACEYKGEDVKYYQWDYPSMWPTNAYFAYEALKNAGLQEKAVYVRDKYISTVEKVFEETGELWEKYDAQNGVVSITPEYETPDMMGWTAGIYEYFCNERK